MTDGSYCEYPGQLDSAMMQHVPNFGGRTSQESFGDGQSKGAGFYVDQFASSMPSTVMETVSAMMLAGANGNPSNQEAVGSGIGDGAPVPVSLYESVMNFAMKPEKGLPLTPPGSPEESKDVQGIQHNMPPSYHSNGNMHPASMVPMGASHHHSLAKPVPMHRLSEKSVAQARACLSSSGPNSSPPGAISELHALGSDMNGSGSVTTPALARAIAAVQQTQKRPRSEKKPIPPEQKDNKYFERRKRNNYAAKKSRDARKAREDEIAIRASFLEKENAILRAQVATLREEANSLRQLLLQKRSRQ